MRKSLFVVVLGVFALHSAFAAENANIPSSKQLRQTYPAFTDIAEKAMPATVFIKVQIKSNTNFSNPFELFNDDFFRRFFGQPFQPPEQQQYQYAGGSGFLISSDGYIVTNNHVIHDASQITVVLNDGREYSGIVKGADPRTDLAVVKIEENNLPYLSFGDSDTLKIGEWVVAIGNPAGLEGTLTAGVVSAKGRQDIGIASYEDFIQTDTVIIPGNSGGPLLNLDGQVIGVNTAIFSKNGGYMGIGFAIPSKMTENVISQIVDSGIVKRGYLGIVLQPIDKELADALDLEKQEGILISDVMPNSPAEKAGLKSGDIILEYNHKPVRNMSTFRNDIALMNPGAELQLQILRNHKTVSCTACLASQADGDLLSGELFRKLGMEVEDLTSELIPQSGLANAETEGVVITRIQPGSPAYQAGLKVLPRSYPIITHVVIDWNNKKPVRTIAELDAALQELGDKKHVILVIRQQNFSRYYTFKVNP